jgi:peroxiredoxin
MTITLLLAAAYNLLWGGAVVLRPNLAFDLMGLERALYPQIWQCVGMIVGVYGVGYAIAAFAPLRHWPIVLVGLLGKVFGPIGFIQAAAAGAFPWSFGWTIITNDLVWWVPFALILRGAWRANTGAGEVPASLLTAREAMERAMTSVGRTVADLSRERPTLVVFLRHSGCTFCREAMSDLRRRRAAIESRGVGLVLVTMSDDAGARRAAEQYGLGDLPRVSDPDRYLYAAFELRRGTLLQLFGPRVFLRGVAATLRGHFVGPLDGDGFQMPGAFLVQDGRIAAAHRHALASDRPDYEQLACASDSCAAPAPAGAGAS